MLIPLSLQEKRVTHSSPERARSHLSLSLSLSLLWRAQSKNTHTDTHTHTLLAYREEHECRRLEWIVRRQRYATKIYTTLEVCPMRSSHGKHPFEEVALKRLGAELVTRLALHLAQLAYDAFHARAATARKGAPTLNR